MTLSTATPIYRKTSVQHGADADKPVYPQAGDEYNSDDLEIKNICFKKGVWNKGIQAVSGQLFHNDKPLYVVDYATSATLLNFGSGLTENVYTVPADVTPMKCKISFSGSSTGSGSPYANIYVQINDEEELFLGLLRRGQSVSTETLLMPGDRVKTRGESAGSGSWTVSLYITALNKINRPVYVFDGEPEPEIAQIATQKMHRFSAPVLETNAEPLSETAEFTEKTKEATE